MKKRVPFVLMCLLTSAILAACGPSRPSAIEQATKIAADIFATQTAQAPIPTNTPTNTPTSTLTPTDTPRPTNTPTPTPEPTGVTIAGSITNLEEMTPLLSENSYLQLVLLLGDVQSNRGTLAIIFSEDGQIETASDLTEIPITPDGTLHFQIEDLESGTYIFVVQLPYESSGFIHVPVLVEEVGDLHSFRSIDLEYEPSTNQFILQISGNVESFAKIGIPENVILPISFDMGEVAIEILSAPLWP